MSGKAAGQPVRGATTPMQGGGKKKGNEKNVAFKPKSRGFKGKVSN